MSIRVFVENDLDSIGIEYGRRRYAIDVSYIKQTDVDLKGIVETFLNERSIRLVSFSVVNNRMIIETLYERTFTAFKQECYDLLNRKV